MTSRIGPTLTVSDDSDIDPHYKDKYWARDKMYDLYVMEIEVLRDNIASNRIRLRRLGEQDEQIIEEIKRDQILFWKKCDELRVLLNHVMSGLWKVTGSFTQPSFDEDREDDPLPPAASSS